MIDEQYYYKENIDRSQRSLITIQLWDSINLYLYLTCTGIGLEDAGEHSKNECREERLSEILEWLLKMDFNLEDIQKWIEGKKAATIPPTPPSRPSSTNGNSSSEDFNFYL